MLAMQLQTPELAISEDEGKEFTIRAQNVMRHYSVETTQKTLDWLAFGGTTVGIYGTRLAAITVRRRQERAEHGRQPGTVVNHPLRFRRTDQPAPQSDDVAAAAQAFGPSVHAGPDDDGEGGFVG